MVKKYNPDTVYPPVAAYYQAVEVPENARWLVSAGQVGMTPDGALVEDPDGQIAQAWRNIAAIVAAAGMTPDDLVKLTIYMVGAEHIVASRNHREAALGDAMCAATLILVAGLADPAMVIEIDVMAAKA
jgi:enamine deaminase RidA (YjgF/YER057c/UK114 family)